MRARKQQRKSSNRLRGVVLNRDAALNGEKQSIGVKKNYGRGTYRVGITRAVRAKRGSLWETPPGAEGSPRQRGGRGPRFRMCAAKRSDHVVT